MARWCAADRSPASRRTMQTSRGNLPSSASSNPGSPRARSPLAMPSSSCRFCRHANPPGAKFCNECGSPLHLRPCPRCEAVTDAGAGTCHQCGAAFGGEAAPIVAATAHAAATNEARADGPQTHRDRTPPSPRDTAARPRISIRGDEDDDAPASSDLTRIAEPAPSTHIPEWLAERFDAANRAGAAGGRTHVPASDAHASSAPDTPGIYERDEAPSRSLLADYDAHRPRRRLSPLLAVATVAIAAGASYVWFDAGRRVPVTTSTPPTSAAPAAAAEPTLPDAHGGRATESPAPVAPPSSSSSAAPAEPRAMPTPRAARARAGRGNGAAANAQARRATSDAERPTNRAAQRERDADETRRLIERDLGGLLTRPPGRSAQ